MALGPLIGLLFFISGFTGLLYEVIWAKYLALLLGSTAHAQVGVLAVFMGGLAVGSVTWGRRADRTSSALALYGALELGIGACAAAFALGFDALSHAYWMALAAFDNSGVGAVAVKMGFCIATMFPATVCMGGTLPVLSRALELRSSGLGRGVAYLYAVNSIGAALGAIVSGFFLVARWGFDAPFLAAAATNIAVGLVAIAVSRTQSDGVPHQSMDVAVAAPPSSLSANEEYAEVHTVRGYTTLVLVAAAVSGGVAMIYEIAWIRLCSLVLGSSTHSFSIMLAAFITGIAAGSLVYVLLNPARRRPLRFFADRSLAAAAALLLCLLFYDRLPYAAGRLTALLYQHEVSFARYQAAILFFCLVVMLPLTFISGLNFPALAQAAGRASAGIGRPVSYVLGANTAGTICGAIIGGLYLLPALGLRGTFLLGIAATIALAVTVLMCDRALPARTARFRAAVALAAFVAYLAIAPSWDLRLLSAGEFRRHEGIETSSFAMYRAGLVQQVLYYRDGISATVSVERELPNDVVLRVNGKADASAIGDADTELLLGHLPAILHPDARRVLVIGYGSGITVGALLQHPVQSVDVVEISSEVIAADEYFRAYNHDALRDRRVHLHVEDARTFLYRATAPYDLIISEPSNPWIAGIGNLFTQEYFEQARRRLTPEGLLVQWFHTYETTDNLVALILRTISHDFNAVRVFLPDRWDVLAVAAATHSSVSRDAMDRAFGHARELNAIGIARLATLLALEVVPDGGVRQLAGPGDLNRDRKPLLEYAAPRAFFEGRNSTLLANVTGVDARLLLGIDTEDCRDIVRYLSHAGMSQYSHAPPILARCLAQAPSDPELLRLLNEWVTAPENSVALLRALTSNPQSQDPKLRIDYARLLLHVVAALHLTPQASDIALVAPVVRAAAEASPDGRVLLEEFSMLSRAVAAPAPTKSR